MYILFMNGKEESNPRMPEFSFLEEKGNKLNTVLFPSPPPPLIASGLGS